LFHHSKRPQIMGIVNMTPDSFYDGGRWLLPEEALAHMEQLAAEGADILDIGAASSRPGYTPVSVEEELARLAPLFALLPEKKLPLLSIDTDKPQVAKAALEAGFGMINATGAPDADMMKLAAEHGAFLVLMFKGPFSEGELLPQVKIFFDRSIAMALDNGVKKEQLIIDPGIGFDMNAEQCLELVASSHIMAGWGYPLLIGLSRKRFLGGMPEDRLAATVAADIFAAKGGAAILRVHDAAAAVSSLDIINKLEERKPLRAFDISRADKIILPSIPAQGHHGAFEGEKDESQPYEVSVTLYTDIRPAAAADDLDRALDYSRIYTKVRSFVAENSFDLLETLAEGIASLLLKETSALGTKVHLRKCRARLGREEFCAEVEILRMKDEVLL